MKTVTLRWIGILLAASCLEAAGPQSPVQAPEASSPYRTVLDRYCVTCHNEKLRTAELILTKEKIDIGEVSEGAQAWEKVVRKLRARTMPPPGMPRPDDATYDAFAAHLETQLDRAAAAKPNPGRPVLHRLNRAEYAGAMRDLLDLEIDPEAFLPPDASSGHGFDNMGDVLTLSPLLMERYLSAAKKISLLAIGDPATPPVVETFVIPENFDQQDRVSEDLPFGSRGGIAIRHYFPLDAEYVVRISLQRIQFGLYAGQVIGMEGQKQIEVRMDGARVKLFSVGDENTDEDLEVRFPAKAGMRLLGVAFLKDTLKQEGALRRSSSSEGGVGWVAIEGPYRAIGTGDTPSRRRIFLCRPEGRAEEEPCAKRIISALARRAYRRPVSDRDVRRLLALYRSGSKEGGFETGIGRALQGILISPEFLFRFERDPANTAPKTANRISDLELASRLSFFLWSSVPDDELLDLAAEGKLRETPVLEQQVQRMLRDSRSEALAGNFAEQWLHVRNLGLLSPPDPIVFPGFTANLRDAFRQETDLFFKELMREDRSIFDLLNADYTFLNERLARHYGVPGVLGSHFRRVTLSDEQRWGLLGKGAILTVTSYATRTSPTLRGKWVLENILGTPPPPPPPDIPSLKEDEKAQKLSMRERMEQHRTNPACATCHQAMDPLGFALENFDAIGRWRTASEDKTSLDVSGELPNGAKFSGPAELRKVLLSQRDQFAATFTQKLLTYALGRGVEYYDMPAVRKILRDAAPSGHRWSSIVLGIVKSVPFQMRRSPES